MHAVQLYCPAAKIFYSFSSVKGTRFTYKRANICNFTFCMPFIVYFNAGLYGCHMHKSTLLTAVALFFIKWTLLSACISNHIYHNVWDEMYYPFSNFNGTAAELGEWKLNFIPHFGRHMIKGLRLVLEGFVVTMHEGACETGSQIPRALARGIWRTVRTSPSALWQQTPTDRS